LTIGRIIEMTLGALHLPPLLEPTWQKNNNSIENSQVGHLT